MPKIKSHRSSAKRFRISKSGKVRARRAYRSHILSTKSAKRKRHLRKDLILGTTQANAVKKSLPYN